MKVRQQFPHLPSIRSRASLQEQLDSLLDLLPDASLLINIRKSTIRLANPAFAELSGYTRHELVGMPLPKILDAPAIHDAPGGEIVGAGQIEGAVKPRSGEPIEVTVEIVPLDDQNLNAVIRFASQSSLARERSDDLLRRSRWEAITVLVLAAEQTTQVEAVHQILRSARLLTGAGILGLYHRQDENKELLSAIHIDENSDLPGTLSFKDISHLQIPRLWKPGERSVSPLHVKAIKDGYQYLASAPLDQSDPLRGILIAADNHQSPPSDILSLLNLIAAALNIHLAERPPTAGRDPNPSSPPGIEARVDFERMIDALDEGFILLDGELRIRTINHAAENILGVNANDMIGKKSEDILISTPPIAPGLIEVLNGLPAWNLENVSIRHRKGQSVPASIRVLSLDRNTNENAIAIIFTDLSDEEQYRARAQQLEQQAFLGEVSAIFAHEVRNPINNISTGLELMSIELADNENVQDQIQRIQDDFERLTDLMKSVLSFSGRREYQIRRVDLVGMVERILDRWRVRTPQNNITFHLSVPKEPAYIEGDQRAIEQVLTNLISNSVKAMDDSGGELIVKFGRQPNSSGSDMVEVLISDTGPGIPADVIEHIFEPFYTTKKEGTGLGLAISKRIVEAHKGKISAQSFPGVTIFKIVLPSADPLPEE